MGAVTLTVPRLGADNDTLTAALAYAKAGWYVGPVDAGTKKPAAWMGKGWPQQTTQEPEVLVSWYSGTNLGVFLHAGRSGAVVFDVDHPDRLPEVLTRAFEETTPPFQSTRSDERGRGHYVFAVPPGRDLGNSVGKLDGDWGEVRGRNGLIVVAPTPHPCGGLYRWQQVGGVPTLPDYLSKALPAALEAADVATDAAVQEFLSAHLGEARRELLDVHVQGWLRKVAGGASRHASMNGPLAGAMKEARAGYFPAKVAADTFQSVFLKAVAINGTGPQQGEGRDGAVARNEWRNLLAWAVAQASAADLEEVRARSAERVPEMTFLVEEPTAVGGTELEPGFDMAAYTREKFPRLDLAALLAGDRPPREYVVENLIPVGASVSLVGPAGSGKSLLVLAMMVAVARGRRTFAGLALTPRRVLYVDMENTEDDLADRFRALGITPGSVGELDNLVVIHLPPLGALDSFAGAAELNGILDTYDVQPGDVVVLDSLQRVIVGAENDADTMRSFYRYTALGMKQRGVTLVRTDNTGKEPDKGARGSSGKRDDVDVELILKADAQKTGRLYITVGKVRLPGIQPITIQQELDEDGLLRWDTGADPHRAMVNAVFNVLDDLHVPIEAGERPAMKALTAAGHRFSRAAVRDAITQRKRLAVVVVLPPRGTA